VNKDELQRNQKISQSVANETGPTSPRPGSNLAAILSPNKIN